MPLSDLRILILFIYFTSSTSVYCTYASVWLENINTFYLFYLFNICLLHICLCLTWEYYFIFILPLQHLSTAHIPLSDLRILILFIYFTSSTSVYCTYASVWLHTFILPIPCLPTGSIPLHDWLQALNAVVFMVSAMGNCGTFTKPLLQILTDFQFLYYLSYLTVSLLGLLLHEFFYSLMVNIVLLLLYCYHCDKCKTHNICRHTHTTYIYIIYIYAYITYIYIYIYYI